MYQDAVNKRQSVELKIGPGNYGYYQVIEQWNAMLVDPEAAEWGAPLILRLLDLVDQLHNKDDTLQVFNAPEWASIRSCIGPAEAGWQKHCPVCELTNIGFGTSGFCDEYYSVDYEAKVVIWQSVYPDGVPEKDDSVCAKCGSELPDKEWGSVFSAIKGFSVVRK